MTGLTQSAFLAFGRAVLYFLILFVFALCERKNEKIIIGKYRSDHRRPGTHTQRVPGVPLSSCHRVSRVK